MKFSDLLVAVGLKPKDLEQARGALEPAKATLLAVAEMFSQAGLDLETMLASGPDALKAHLDALTVSDKELLDAEERNASLLAETTTLKDRVQTYSAAFDATGFKVEGVSDVKTAFADHVKKAAAVELAKAGHPPVPVSPEIIPDAQKSDADLHAEWKKMPNGPARLAFFSKHEAAIRRAAGLKH